METIKLYQMAEKRGIKVDRYNLPENRSVSIKLNDNFFIALDEKMNTHAEEKVSLAHELGHCETLGFYNINAGADIRGKQEKRATRWAIKTLIPEENYHNALRRGYTDIYSLAEYFGVTEEFMVKVAQFYSYKINAI